MSPRLPQSFIDEVLSRVDILSIIESRVPLKKSGANYSACCPFHQEKTPSFMVSPSKQIFHCFGCGKGGTAISFLMEYEHLNFMEVIELLAAQTGLELPKEHVGYKKTDEQQQLYQLMRQAAAYFYKQRGQSETVMRYIKQRGLTDDIMRSFGVGFAPSNPEPLLDILRKQGASHDLLTKTGLFVQTDRKTYRSRFRNRLMFPIRDRRGRIIAFGGRVLQSEDQPKYLNSPETPLFHKSNVLYGLYEALAATRQLNRLIVVEGYMDVVSLAQHGMTEAVATLGTAVTVDQVQRLFRVCKTIVFCFDGDAAGRKAAWRALEVLFSSIQDTWRPKFVFLPESEDPDSFVRRYGKEKFEALLDAAQDFSSYFFEALHHSYSIETVDGRAQFATQAMHYLNLMPDLLLKEVLLEQLSTLVQMPLDKLTKFLVTREQPLVEQQMTELHLDPSLQKILMLLIQNPKLVSKMEHATLCQVRKDSSGLLNQLIVFIQAHEDVTTATILEYWREKPYADLVYQLAVQNYLLDLQTLENEFQDTLKKLGQLDRELQIESHLKKARAQGLSEEEKSALMQLLKDQA
ncbi:MAG: DNA primase [Pseudomonadota bacterium]